MLSLLHKGKSAATDLQEQADFFMSQGYYLFDTNLPDNLLDTFRVEADRLYEARKTEMTKPALTVDNIINVSRVFHPLIKFTPVYNLLQKLFGPDLNLLSTGMRYCLPGTPSQAWHIDYKRGWQNLRPENPMWKPFPTIIAAYYLDDLTLENGPLWVVPGSQLRAERPMWEDVSLPDERPLMVKAGDCILFDARTWHRGGANTTVHPRRAIFFDYSLYWVKKPYRFEGPEIDHLIARSDNDMLYLLGLP